MPDYAKLNRLYSRQKAALTRAVKTGNRATIRAACAKAVAEWNAPESEGGMGGCWPDDWSRWQRALDDAYPVFEGPSLESLG